MVSLAARLVLAAHGKLPERSPEKAMGLAPNKAGEATAHAPAKSAWPARRNLLLKAQILLLECRNQQLRFVLWERRVTSRFLLSCGLSHGWVCWFYGVQPPNL